MPCPANCADTTLPKLGFSREDRTSRREVTGTVIDGETSTTSRSVACSLKKRAVIDFFPLFVPAKYSHARLGPVGLRRCSGSPCSEYWLDKVSIST